MLMNVAKFYFSKDLDIWSSTWPKVKLNLTFQFNKYEVSILCSSKDKMEVKPSPTIVTSWLFIGHRSSLSQCDSRGDVVTDQRNWLDSQLHTPCSVVWKSVGQNKGLIFKNCHFISVNCKHKTHPVYKRAWNRHFLKAPTSHKTLHLATPQQIRTLTQKKLKFCFTFMVSKIQFYIMTECSRNQ